jgi:hypothetical protein
LASQTPCSGVAVLTAWSLDSLPDRLPSFLFRQCWNDDCVHPDWLLMAITVLIQWIVVTFLWQLYFRVGMNDKRANILVHCVLVDVETTVHVQTVGAYETTDEWPRIDATAWSETNKPDCLNRMSKCSFFLFNLRVISYHVNYSWILFKHVCPSFFIVPQQPVESWHLTEKCADVDVMTTPATCTSSTHLITVQGPPQFFWYQAS